MKKTTVLKLVAASTAALFSIANADTSSFTADQQKQIEGIVHDYLVKNPEVLIEASQVLQKRQMDAAQAQAMKGALANKDALFANSADPVAGNAKGDVSIVEFFDYQCPHCIEMTPVLEAIIKSNANVRIVYKEFPIFGEVSDFASRAALAANKQGKYAEFHNALMGAHKRLDKNMILDIAKNVGLDIEKLQADMKASDIDEVLKNNRSLAQTLQLMGTPAFAIAPSDTKKIEDKNISFIPGQTDEKTLQQAIDKAK